MTATAKKKQPVENEDIDLHPLMMAFFSSWERMLEARGITAGSRRAYNEALLKLHRTLIDNFGDVVYHWIGGNDQALDLYQRAAERYWGDWINKYESERFEPVGFAGYVGPPEIVRLPDGSWHVPPTEAGDPIAVGPVQTDKTWTKDRLPGETAPEFIQRIYGRWIGKGLRTSDLRKDRPLYSALMNWKARSGKELPFELPSKKEMNDKHLRQRFGGDSLETLRELERAAAAMRRRLANSAN